MTSATPYMQSAAYLAYLIEKCGVRGHDVSTGDNALPDVDIVVSYSKWLDLKPAEKVLEVGCGVGRILFELHDVFGVCPSGIDIFPEVIQEARKRIGGICDYVEAAPAEKIPMNDGAFDKVICWGVFDLTDQADSLHEMARVLKPGGQLLVTGKNDCYYADDSEAGLAEAASARKGIPNHYTEFSLFESWAVTLGLTLERGRFFPRRGDFAANIFVEDRPERFYEYCVLFRKDHASSVTGTSRPLIGRARSRTSLEFSST